MLAVLVFLTYMFIMSIILLDSTLPVQCVFSSPETDSITKAHLAYQVQNASELASFALALFLIICGYIVRIQGLYFSQSEPSYVVRWLIRRTGIGRSANLTDAQDFMEYRAFSRRQTLRRIKASSGIPRRMLSARYRYQGSFLSSLSTILFSFTYGIAQVVGYRWHSGVDLTSEASDMGFGQITALFLLCLPFLVAGETYHGGSGSSTKTITASS
jgi:hypothetical protein